MKIFSTCSCRMMEDLHPDSQSDDEILQQGPKRSKIWAHCTKVFPHGTANPRLQCNYCAKAYSYGGGNTSAIIQHFRKSHQQVQSIREDFPHVPVKSASQQKK